jgi:hypothetical protein
MSPKLENVHQKHRRHFATSTATHAPHKFCRKSNRYLEMPLHCWSLERRSRLSNASLVSSYRTRNHDTQLIATLPHQPPTLGTSATPWSLRLQPHPTCTSRQQSANPQNTNQLSHLGSTWSRRLVPWRGPQTLSLSPSLCQQHLSRTHRQNCRILPTQLRHAQNFFC